MARILVVEDSPTQALAIRGILQANGFSAEVVGDGEAALARLGAAPFDLVLSDIVMPGLSGYDLCRRLKTDPATQGIPVVLLTALTDPLDILQGLECGADNFLTKPCEPHFLVRRLRSILDKRTRRAGQQQTAGVALSFRGRGLTITSDKEQILDLLVSTLEEYMRAQERAHEVRVAREGAERSQQFVQAALDALATGVAILDDTGRVLALNAAWRSAPPGNPLCGPACGVGANYLLLCAAVAGGGLTAATALVQGIRAVMAGAGGTFSLEYACPAAQGERWFGVRVTRFAQAVPVRVVVAHEDLTPRKGLEEALRQKAGELAEADRRKDSFLAVLAHELRNPLAAVVSGLHVAQQHRVDEDRRAQALASVERQTRYLSRLVGDLLEVTRLQTGDVQVRLERLDLGRLARAVVEDFRLAQGQAGVALALDVPETPVWVLGDATRLSQVLNHLLDNALKFSDRGGRVTVGVSADTGRQQAVLKVRDQGAGIEPEMLGRLFEAFAQADRSLDRGRGGLGLGLALVKGLVERHGGGVEASSMGTGEGAEFVVRLPLQGELPALVEPAARPQATGPRRRVLVVEDNRDAAASLCLLLEMLGHEVTAAHSGPEGVRAALAWVPDIVLCDIGLPGLDGYGVARELRLHPATSRVRLLALTGYGSDDDRRRSRQAGFDRHLVKPVSVEELQGALAASS